MMRLRSSAFAAFAATVGFGLSAAAQQAAGTAAVGVQGTATANTQTGATAQADPNANAAAPAPAPAADPAPAQNQQMGMGMATATAAPPPGGSDHDAMVGHLAVGFLGRATMPIGVQDAANPNPQLPVPIIGVRYWMDPMVGLDLGLGLYLGGQSNEATPAGGASTSASGPSPTAFMLHAGVPLALATAKHFAFEIIPEANFGYAKVSWDQAAAPGGPGATFITSQSGVHLDVGARAGGEIHFGFMGIPQLSLVGSVGLRFDYDKVGRDLNTAAGAAAGSQSTGTWALRTTVYDSPWNIFISNVSAFYYF